MKETRTVTESIVIDEDAIADIQKQFQDTIDVLSTTSEFFSEKIYKTAMLMVDAIMRGGKVVFFGNGGSASDAQHLAGELVGKFLIARRAYPAIALNTNASIMTAVANDYEYSSIFTRQVEALVRRDDVVVGISTSGSSVNIIEGVRAAKRIGATTIGLIGNDGGELSSAVDIALVVPSFETPRIQEVHITMGHIICGLVEKYLYEVSG